MGETFRGRLAAIQNFIDSESADARLPLGFNLFIGSAIGRNCRFGILIRF